MHSMPLHEHKNAPSKKFKRIFTQKKTRNKKNRLLKININSHARQRLNKEKTAENRSQFQIKHNLNMFSFNSWMFTVLWLMLWFIIPKNVVFLSSLFIKNQIASKIHFILEQCTSRQMLGKLQPFTAVINGRFCFKMNGMQIHSHNYVIFVIDNNI